MFKCPICSSDTYFLYRINDAVTTESFNLHRCSSCELEFLPEQPENIAHYYDNHLGETMTKSSRFFRFLQKISIRKEFGFISRHKLSFKRVCIFGSGAGGERDVLEEMYSNVISADFNPADASTTRLDLNDEKAIRSFIKDMKVEFISLRHVLEHLRRPIDILTLLNKSNVGCINIIVPNGRSIFKRFFKNYWSLYDPPRHLFTFNEKNLRLLLDKTGYRVIEVKYYGFDEMILSLERFLSIKGINIPFLRVKRLIPTLSSVFFSLVYKGSAIQVVAVKK